MLATRNASVVTASPGTHPGHMASSSNGNHPDTTISLRLRSEPESLRTRAGRASSPCSFKAAARVRIPLGIPLLTRPNTGQRLPVERRSVKAACTWRAAPAPALGGFDMSEAGDSSASRRSQPRRSRPRRVRHSTRQRHLVAAVTFRNSLDSLVMRRSVTRLHPFASCGWPRLRTAGCRLAPKSGAHPGARDIVLQAGPSRRCQAMIKPGFRWPPLQSTHARIVRAAVAQDSGWPPRS